MFIYIAAVLAVLLLEDVARDAARLALFGEDALTGGGAWDGEDGLSVFRVGSWESGLKVGFDF